MISESEAPLLEVKNLAINFATEHGEVEAVRGIGRGAEAFEGRPFVMEV